MSLAELAVVDPVCAERRAGFERQVFGVEDWRLSISRDRFSGETSCSLSGHDGKILFDGIAFGFSTGEQDVLRSWYRIDSNAPRRWRDDLPELARLKVSLNGRSMAAPTDGIVWIPASVVQSARTVSVQTSPGRKARTFLLSGFDRLYAYALTHGCTPTSRFLS